MNLPLRPVPALAALAIFGAGLMRGDVAPAPLFTDQAVLQRDKAVPVWGTAEPGEKITVTFGTQRREATAGYDGRWIVMLEPMPGTSAGQDLTLAGRNTITLHDVVVGEVWICSGQSNMEWPVQRAMNADAEIAAARFPQLRHIRIEPTVAKSPAATVRTSGWQTTTPQTVGAFTAVGYFFARDLQPRLGVPVGLIHSSWGGTPVEAWMSPAALNAELGFAVVNERWSQAVSDYPRLKAEYDGKLLAWTKAEAEAKAAAVTRAEATPRPKGGAKPDPSALHAEWLRQNPRPRPPRGEGDSWTPSGLFNGMINPLLPYALRGALWYQGESNADRASEYHALFAALITGWRAHFAQGDFPFYWVSLANYGVPTDQWERGRTFAFLREAQAKTLSLPNTGQALAIDVGNPRDIHPTNKQEVGRRLALLARNRVYGITGDDTGPTFVSAVREGSAMRVRLAHAAGGLIARDKPIQSLEVAGADRVFQPAVGRIERETLLVASLLVREPVAVRYAWSNSPEANLYNGAGLPAAPFRSDDW